VHLGGCVRKSGENALKSALNRENLKVAVRSAEDPRYDWRDQSDGRRLRAKQEKAFRETAGSERRQSITGGKET
jgi:hypothetical protein